MHNLPPPPAKGLSILAWCHTLWRYLKGETLIAGPGITLRQGGSGGKVISVDGASVSGPTSYSEDFEILSVDSATNLVSISGGYYINRLNEPLYVPASTIAITAGTAANPTALYLDEGSFATKIYSTADDTTFPAPTIAGYQEAIASFTSTGLGNLGVVSVHHTGGSIKATKC